jgi:hypothetical protein
VSLNAHRHNVLPHSALNGKSPFSILYPNRDPPLELFKPFGCAATLLKDAKDLRNKTMPSEMSGIYVGTSLPLGQHGYLIWVPERHRFVTATHTVFDETYFPARTFQKRVSDFFGTLPATQDADSIHASLRGEPPSRSSAPSSPPSTDQDDAYDSDDELPGLLAESSDSEGENNDHDDVDDDDFVVFNKKSTTPEPQIQQEKQTRHPTSTYFDEFELNPDLPDSIYFREPLDTDDEDETSTEVIEKMEPKAPTTRSGRTYATANTAKARYKPGFDIHEGKGVNIKGFLSIGNEDIDAGGVISNAFLARVLVKALKAHARENPDMRKEAVKEIALPRNPTTVREALETPQRKEWIEAIRKEMQSLVDKRVFEIKKVPPGRKVIPLRIVLKIKLASDGTIDKYKARCVVAGFRQTAGLDYNPQGTYSPMTEPTTLRLILSIANALDLELDHLDIPPTLMRSYQRRRDSTAPHQSDSRSKQGTGYS